MSDSSPTVYQKPNGNIVRQGKHDCPCCGRPVSEEQQKKPDGFTEIGGICQAECGWSQYTLKQTEPFEDLVKKRVSLPEDWVYLLCQDCEKGEVVEQDSYAAQHADEIESPCCGGVVERFDDEYRYGY